MAPPFSAPETIVEVPGGRVQLGEILPGRFPGWQGNFAFFLLGNKGFPGPTEPLPTLDKPSFFANKPLSAPNKPSFRPDKPSSVATEGSDAPAKAFFASN